MRTGNYTFFFRIGRHFLFWLTFFGLLFIVTGFRALNRNFFYIDLPITLFYSYIIAYLIIPYFLSRRRFFLLFISVTFLSLALSYIRLLNYDYLYYSLYASELSERNTSITFPILVLNAKDFSFGLIIFLAAKYTFDWIQTENEEVRIEKEQMETEVRFMRTQVDPHFLFNTMNNLYSLSVSGSPDLRKHIRKMWGLMDYINKQMTMKEIPLNTEIKLISDYVDLERLRYGDRLEFQLKVTGNIKEYRVPPMIFYPFVENCFKHGCASDPNSPWVHLSIIEMKDRIRFIARNSLPGFYTPVTRYEKGQSGIDNIRKRLEYQLPGRYKLKIDQKTAIFEVMLDIYY